MPATPGGTTPQTNFKGNPDGNTPTTGPVAPLKTGLGQQKKEPVAPKQLSGINPKIDLSCLTTPDVALIDKTNKPCEEIRA